MWKKKCSEEKTPEVEEKKPAEKTTPLEGKTSIKPKPRTTQTTRRKGKGAKPHNLPGQTNIKSFLEQKSKLMTLSTGNLQPFQNSNVNCCTTAAGLPETFNGKKTTEAGKSTGDRTNQQ